ncbi:hypothetical protein [Actinoplanes sp. N902-109]|uniref:hypothetical protein n=1 Tax=Actinoplanes sp. (strain N902-109) TaxID=649831 RepID=UPI0005A0890C|nr:hypothetical protein [Actinoplanes sp. N902-109]
MNAVTDRDDDLAAAISRREVLVCSTLTADDLAESEDPRQLLHADTVRRLLVEADASGDPLGVRVKGARVTGQLNLDGIRTDMGLNFEDCVFDEWVTANRATLASVRFYRCRLPAIAGTQLTVHQSVLVMNCYLPGSAASSSTVRLRGAKIGGNLSLTGSRLQGRDGVVLDLQAVVVGQSVALGRLAVRAAAPTAAVVLYGAQVAGDLSGHKTFIENTAGSALTVEQAHIKGAFRLRDSQLLTDHDRESTLIALRSTVDGTFSLEGTLLRNRRGCTLQAEGLQVGGPVLLRRGFRATGGGDADVVRFFNARLALGIECDGAELVTHGGTAFNGNAMVTGGPVLLRDGFLVHGRSRRPYLDMARAKIGGDLDLCGAGTGHAGGPVLRAAEAQISGSVLLNGCLLEGACGTPLVDLRRAGVAGDVNLRAAMIDNRDGTAVDVGQARIGGFLQLPASVRAGGPASPAIDASFVSVGQSLTAYDCTVMSAGPAILLHQAQVTGSVLLDRVSLADQQSSQALVTVTEATVGGLRITRARLSSRCGPLVDAAYLTARSPVRLDHVDGSTDCPRPAIQLLATNLLGDLELSAVRLSNAGGSAVKVLRSKVTGSFHLGDDSRLDCRSDAAVELGNVTVGADLSLHAVRLSTGTGRAIVMSGVATGGNIELSRCAIESLSTGAAVSLLSVRCRDLWLTSLTWSTPRGTALAVGDSHIDADLTVRSSRISAGGSQASIVIERNTIRANCQVEGLRLVTTSATAVGTAHCVVEGGVRINGTYEATGTGEAAVVVDSVTAGRLCLDGCRITSRQGSALVIEHTRVAGVATLGQGFRADGHGDRPTVALRDTTIGRHLRLDRGMARAAEPPFSALELTSVTATRILLTPDFLCSGAGPAGDWRPDGFVTVNALSMTDLRGDRFESARWREILTRRSTRYSAQPYQKIAALYRALGHEATAREFLIAQQRDLRRRGSLGGYRQRAWHAAMDTLVGYGYQTWRAVVWLVLVMVLAMALGIIGGHQDRGGAPVLVRRATAAAPGQAKPGVPQRCTLVEQIGVGLDRGLPLVNTGVRDKCEINTNTVAGQWATGIAWLLQVLAWLFATLAVAGYTGLIKKV